ncbi:MAG: hypothetical protein IJZ72_05540 [Oscillospiraceae bacterium]|nr:hypothetical protein [Oscillospiraceae bacterium]
MLMTFSVLGLIGGILCAVGDILFDLKGAGNQKTGPGGNVDTNWIKMADWRFVASIIFAFFGDIFVMLGIYSLGMQIAEKNTVLGYVTAILGCAGTVGGCIIHTSLCIQPLLYKRLIEAGRPELVESVLKTFYKAIAFPFFFGYVILMTPCVTSIIAIVTGCLDVPKWFVLLNSIVFLIVGVTFRKIDPKRFQDLPGIIMPSMGLAMLGLIGIVNLM